MAGKYDISIEQGSDTQDISFTITDDEGEPADLTGYTAAMQIRKRSGGDILDTLTTENDRITIVEDSGVWTTTLKFPAVISAAYTFAKAAYDLELISNSDLVERLLEGSVSIDANITL